MRLICHFTVAEEDYRKDKKYPVNLCCRHPACIYLHLKIAGRMGLLKKLVLSRTVGAALCGCPVFTANLKAGTETCTYIIRFSTVPGCLHHNNFLFSFYGALNIKALNLTIKSRFMNAELIGCLLEIPVVSIQSIANNVNLDLIKCRSV